MTTTTTAPPTADSFGILLTEQWLAIPLEIETHRDFTARTVERLRAEPDFGRADERRLELFLSKVRRDLRAGNARFAAFFAEAIDADDPDHDGTRDWAIAGLTFSVQTRTDLRTEVPLTMPVLFAAFANERLERDDVRISNIESPTLTDLPAGRAVHLRRLYESAAALPRFEPYFAETFVISLGDDACGLLQFSTANLHLARSFSGMFGRLAQTVTMFGDDSPTRFGPPVESTTERTGGGTQ